MKKIKVSELTKGIILQGNNDAQLIIKSIAFDDYNGEKAFITLEHIQTGTIQRLQFIDVDNEYTLADSPICHKTALAERQQLKNDMLDNSNELKYSLNQKILSLNSDLIVSGIGAVKAGRGFKKHSISLWIGKAGCFDAELNFHIGSLKIESFKTVGKYPKKDIEAFDSECSSLFYSIKDEIAKFIESLTTVNKEPETVEPVTTEQQPDNSLSDNEKQVISTRLCIDPSKLNNSIFTTEQLKNEKIISLIGEHAESLVNDVLLKNENIVLPAHLYEWNNKHRDNYNYYISNIKTNILDGTYSDTYNAILNDYNDYNNKMDHIIKVERSFELPDYEVPLNIFIERSNQYEGKLKVEHENIVKNAIENGLTIPNEVLADYKHLVFEPEPTRTTEPTKTYIAGNRSFNTYHEAESYCIQSDFDPTTMIQIKEAYNEPLSTTEQTITYQLYKHIFNTYNEAYAYAIEHDMPDTMILPSDYPMSYERLQELNKYYTFSPAKMPYDDTKEYFNHISQCKHSLDQETRYFKLKDLIQRKEYHIQRTKDAEQLLHQKVLEVDTMFKTLRSHGVIVNDPKYGNTTYHYNNKIIYSWASGIHIDDQHRQLTEVYNDFMTQLQAV